MQGFFEVSDPEEITPDQMALIKKHLQMVFIHEIDPSFGDAEAQAELDAVHNGEIIKTALEKLEEVSKHRPMATGGNQPRIPSDMRFRC